MKIITSWDDGTREDLGLASMLKYYNMPGLFFIPNTCKLTEEQIRRIAKDFSVGGHTFSHPEDMKKLPKKVQYFQISENKKWLEEIVGKEITDFCYPKGKFNDDTVEAAKAAGFKTGRTVNVMNTDIPEDPFRIVTTVHVHPKREEYKGRKWLDVAWDLYCKAKEKENGYFHLWGHSWELEKFNLWEDLETFLVKVEKDRTNI